MAAAPAPPTAPLTVTGRVRRTQAGSAGTTDALDRFDVGGVVRERREDLEWRRELRHWEELQERIEARGRLS